VEYLEKNIAFIGAGAIAEALLKGICHTGVTSPSRLAVTNKTQRERLDFLAATYGIKACSSYAEAVKDADVIFLCTKPKDLVAALTEAARYAPANALYISVAAGCSIALIEDVIRCSQPLVETGRQAVAPRVIRTMPNTSSAVLESATAYALGAACSEEDAALAHTLLTAVGRSYRIDEAKLDAVTGLSGTGPAYVYYLVEALILAGTDVGLDHETAVALVTQTLIGAATMLRQSGESPAALRQRVTSPGGTTMAGIAALDEHGFTFAVREAVARATARSAELGAPLQSTPL